MTATGRSDDPGRAVLQRAEALGDLGRFADLYDLVTQALGEHPDEPRLLAYATWSCLQLDRADEAVGFAEDALTAGPDLAMAHLFASHAYLATGEGRRALVAIERALELEPDSATVHTQHAFVRIAGGSQVLDKDLARQALGRALELEADNPEHLLLVAQGYRALKDRKRARELVGRGLTLAPGNPALLLEKIRMTDAEEDATHLLTGVLAASPENLAARSQLHTTMWSILRRPANTATTIVTFILFVGGWLWSDRWISGVAVAGMWFTGCLLIMGWATLRVSRSVPAGVLRRTLREGGGWAYVGQVLSWGSLALASFVGVGMTVVRSHAGVGGLIVYASVTLAVSGLANALMVVAGARGARLQGLYPPGEEGTQTFQAEWRRLRSAIIVVLTVFMLLGLATAALVGGEGRTDALWAAVWGLVMWVVAPVTRFWLTTVELRRRAMTRTQTRAMTAPVLVTVVLLLGGLTSLMNGPFSTPDPSGDGIRGIYGNYEKWPSPLTTYGPGPLATFDPGSLPRVIIDPSLLPSMTVDPSLISGITLDPDS